MATFRENVLVVLCLFVILVVFHFWFRGLDCNSDYTPNSWPLLTFKFSVPAAYITEQEDMQCYFVFYTLFIYKIDHIVSCCMYYRTRRWR